VDKLNETKGLADKPESILVVVADVASETGRREIAKVVQTSCPRSELKYLVHNAGVVGPLKRSAEVAVDDFRSVMATNVEAPIFLSSLLFSNLKACRGRVLHVSSGCAHKPSANWLTYCTSKAALLMAYRCLSLEWAGQVAVGSFKPGIVETEMQEEMRKASKDDFPKGLRSSLFLLMCECI